MCCGTRGTQGCTAAGTWSPCTVTGVPEVCNGADDDCDGVIDNDLTFTAGELADAGIFEDGGCSVGVGVCARTAGAVCAASGQVTCGAVAGTPGTEICDALDNDCDGDVDEQLKILCIDDSDADQYATPDAGALPMCPDPQQPTVCPTGFISPSGSRGLDCAPTDATLFRISNTRTDEDGDAYCNGASRPFCTGLTAPAGRRFTGDCMGTGNDCNDQDAGVFVLADFRTDVDNDNYCVGAVQQVCSGITRPMGLKAASLCAATNDCNDGNNQQFVE
ncbi:MAG: hypothetical protein JNM17_38540, partial [Archangium sp.]|nr:hypothetical protein [Archangium sp.]